MMCIISHMKTIRVSDETYSILVGLKGFLELKDRVDLSMGDMIDELIEHYPKQHLDLDNNDIFEVTEPAQPEKGN
jgi:predicted CopG family antitoxin